MKLRKHQSELLRICGEILEGKPIDKIIAAVTPGGGKSAMPVILTDNLIGNGYNRICWIVPRNSLKYQGEKEFLNKRWNTRHRLRAAQNSKDMSQGLSGYITTYQAVGENPIAHFEEFSKYQYILFLDEPHHVSCGSSWENALEPLIKMSKLVIFASGTLSRNDGKKIAFLKYNGEFVDLNNNKTTRVIKYSKQDAINDESTLPIRFDLIDGESEWKEDVCDEVSEKDKISSFENGSQALYCALRTEFAYELMAKCLDSFQKYLSIKPDAKMLVVSPNIEYASRYQRWLSIRGLNSRIATSDDSSEARNNIANFTDGKFNLLVTVSMAYEGLSVSEISHIALLTFTRSIPWLEQCFARANRLSENKNYGLVVGPKDMKLLQAIKQINKEGLVPLKKQPENIPVQTSTSGIVKPWIHPLASKAIGINIENQINIAPFIEPSKQEKILREEINKIRNYVVNHKGIGGRAIAQKLMDRKIRQEIDKTVSEASIKELEQVWLRLRKNYLTK